MLRKTGRTLAMLGPGLLVAATGVGAGDLATAAFTGNRLGMAVLWAVLVGAFLKFVVNEGLARWQLATGTSLLQGCVTHLGWPFRWCFLVYLLLWSFLVGLALISACGVTMHAIAPWRSPNWDKAVYGVLHSLIAVVLVRFGGYALFEKVMTVVIGIMFTVVAVTAIAVGPPPGEVLTGLVVPTIPRVLDGGLQWTIALIGGVGGTLTILCYGYWIKEEGRTRPEDLRTCRIDLACGYVMTALFGVSMVIIGSQIASVQGGGATLLVDLARGLEATLGSYGWAAKWAFLIGAWGAVFSSLLGVWQSLPYLFTDFWNLAAKSRENSKPNTQSFAYRGYLYGLATIPATGLWALSFESAQKTYAVVGALVVPILAGVLLYLNNRSDFVGQRFCNRWQTNLVLLLCLLFFLWAGWLGVRAKLGW